MGHDRRYPFGFERTAVSCLHQRELPVQRSEQSSPRAQSRYEAAAPGYLHLLSPFRLVHCTPLSFPNLPLLSLTSLSFLLQLRLVFLDLISSFVQMCLLWFLAYRFGECCCNRV